MQVVGVTAPAVALTQSLQLREEGVKLHLKLAVVNLHLPPVTVSIVHGVLQGLGLLAQTLQAVLQVHNLLIFAS